MSHLKKVYGRQAMAEIVNDLINKQTGEVLVERGERAAQKPEIAMTEDEKEADAILRGEQDFEFTIAYEVLPDFELPDVSDASRSSVRSPKFPTTEIDEQVEKIAESARPYEEKKGKAAKGDRVTMDYAGSIDGTPFEGGTDTDATLVLGSGRFIPGFEDQLIGAKAGDELTVNVTFPADYQAPHLAGKEAEFAVKVTRLKSRASSRSTTSWPSSSVSRAPTSCARSCGAD